MSVGFGPTIGNHEIQKKVGFFYSANSKKTRKKLDFHIFMKFVKTAKPQKKLGISKILKTSLFRLRNMCWEGKHGVEQMLSPVGVLAICISYSTLWNLAPVEAEGVHRATLFKGFNQSVNSLRHRFLVNSATGDLVVAITPPTRWSQTQTKHATLTVSNKPEPELVMSHETSNARAIDS